MPKFFTCEHCDQTFEINPLQDEDQEERNLIAKFGIFAADLDIIDVCENCYNSIIRHSSQFMPLEEEDFQSVPRAR